MNINLIEALQQQQNEAAHMNPQKWCSRREEQMLQLESPLAQIVIGVRRSGKSTLCHKFLKQNGVKYAYINFDDERLGVLKANELDQVLEAAYYVYGGFNYLFLDEPQNVNGWHLFVNRLLRQGVFMFVTGSNAKLLSGELATHLTGRYNQVELFPLSFREYTELKGIRSDAKLTHERAFRQKAFDEYLEKGGLPELLNLPLWKNYVDTLFRSIVERDIVQRFKIRNKQAMLDIGMYAVSNFGREFNFKKLEKQLGVTSDNTIKNYVAHLEQAFLLIGLNKFSFKTSERLRNRKYYLSDTAFASALGILTGHEAGWRFENIVFVELLRRKFEGRYDIHYFKSHFEIDFVLSAGFRVIELIQVCLDISSAKTMNREIRALLNGSKLMNCNKLTLITLGNSQNIETEGKAISIISVFDWL
jgi:predicted AAA+ superfamily ATPase